MHAGVLAPEIAIGIFLWFYLLMWYSTQLVITWLVHWFIDSMALMICKETSSPFSISEGNCNDHPEQLGGSALLAVQVVAHQVHILLGQQQGHLPIKGQIGKGLIKVTLVLTATRSSAKCCSS